MATLIRLWAWSYPLGGLESNAVLGCQASSCAAYPVLRVVFRLEYSSPGGVGKQGGDNSQQKWQSYSVLYSNMRSILNKFLEFKVYVYDNKPDVICLCETFRMPCWLYMGISA